ncbi:MAG TPA: hypothetical protein VFB25_10825 [Gaiellaceae bacterium]|nr:hypothetical protein [Gaiellaceae bacterium]
MAHDPRPTLPAAALYSQGLVWLSHPEHGNRNVEADELEQYLADGWTHAKAEEPTPRPAIAAPSAGLVAMAHPDPKFGNRAVEPAQVEKMLAQGFKVVTA